MKRLIWQSLISLSLALLMAGGLAGLASAHELKENNGIVAVLHIEPDDNPIAQRPTVLQIEFASTSDSFALKNYDVQLKIVENNKTLKSYAVQPAAGGSNSIGEATVTFPAGSVYDVVVSGTARQPGHANFSVDYLTRVGGAITPTNHQSAGLQTILLGLASLALLTMIAITNIRSGGRYASAAAAKPRFNHKKQVQS